MSVPNPHRSSHEPFSQRLDRAAAALNPTLVIIIVGLIILNIIAAFALVPWLRISHGPPAYAACATATANPASDPIAVPDARAGDR
jgi:hypothetical protein